MKLNDSPSTPATTADGQSVSTDPSVLRNEKTVFYPLISDPEIKNYIEQAIQTNSAFTLADPGTTPGEDECDVYLIDYETLSEQDSTQQAFQTAEPELKRPVLGVFSIDNAQKFFESSTRSNTEPVDGSGGIVDEVITYPAPTSEFIWRIESALEQYQTVQRFEEQTRYSAEVYRALDEAGHAIFLTDADGVIQYVNDAFEALTGYEESEVIGETPAILNSGQESEAYFEALWETIQDGQVWDEEIVNQRKSGELYTAHQTISPIPTAGEGTTDVQGYIAIQTDITAEDSSMRELELYRSIVDRLDNPIVLQDLDGEVVMTNDAVEGLSKGERDTGGKDVSSVLDKDTEETIQTKREFVLSTETPVTIEVPVVSDELDKQKYYQVTIYPHYNIEGAIDGTVAIGRDITDLERRSRQLRVVDNILRHNLRNNLTVVHGIAGQIRDAETGNVEQEAAKIQKQAERLMSKGEKSRQITEILSENPSPRVIDAVETVSAAKTNILNEFPDASIEIVAPGPIGVTATPHLEKAVTELLRNAVQHTDPGTSIEVIVEPSDSEETARITVRDSGDGLPETDRDVLETGQAVGKLSHGSGIGLWLVYWVVDQSNGFIEVVETGCDGTEIQITVPLVDGNG